jgi:hypothetical protein
MALILKDRVKETTAVTSTGTATLLGASVGYQSFSVIGNGNTCYYTIAAQTTNEWEVGIGTYTSPNQLSRDTVLSSSNSNALVNFSAGTKDVFVAQPAGKAVYTDASNTINTSGNGANTVAFTNINASNVVMVSGTISTNAANATDITNKTYVDGLFSTGITYHAPVLVESPTALIATYNQPGGAGNGVGATLTNSGANVALSIDGVSLSNTARVLVYTQSNAVHNGVYTVTNAGAPDVPGPGAAWVLTRATDADTYGVGDPNKLGQGDAFFVQSGNTGAGETYILNTVGTITFGTTNLTFAQISSAQVYSAGTGLNLANLTFSIANTAVTAATYGNAGQVPQIAVNAQGQITSASNVSINASSITLGTLDNARTTAASANGASTIVARDANGNFTANVITATTSNATTFNGTTGSFTNVSGNGVALTAINASNITSGTIANARTTASDANSASTIVARDANGSFGANIITATFSGNGATLSAINASNISSGTIANARTTAASANGASTIVQRDSGGNFSANTVTAAVIGDLSGGSNINASNIASGTIANARTTASSSNGASTIVLRGASGEFAAGAITGASFSGNGSAITAINASAITTGTIDNARTTASSANGASTIVARDSGGNFSANTITATTFSGAHSGNGASLTNINASNISSGTIANARTTGTDAATAATLVLRDANGSFAANVVTATTISGNGASLTNINASNISSGTIANARTTAATANGASTIVLRGTSGEFSAGAITATTGSFSGTITSTVGGQALNLNGATSNRIDWNANGVAAPTFTTRSAGTKLVLYPGVAAASADYAIGIESGNLWFSADTTTAGFKWYGGTTLVATLTGTGNLGLGVTPSAWISSWKAIQIGASGSLSSRTDVFGTLLAQNAFINTSGNNTYIGSAAASQYFQTAGQHQWFNAPSGTAGNTITFTQAMTLDASGDLLLGQTSSAYSSANRRLISINGTNEAFIGFNTSGNYKGYIQHDGTNFTQENQTATGYIRFATNSTERMRINSAGEVCIGNTSALLTAAGRGNITLNGSSSSILTFGIGGTASGYIFSSATNLELDAQSTRFMSFNTGGAERMRITSTGSVFVGASALVSGTSSAPKLYVVGATPAVNSGTGGQQLIVTSSETSGGDNGGVIGFAGPSAGSGVNIKASIAGKYESATGGNAGYMQFATLDSAGTLAERMRITSTGNVGIGTSAPQTAVNIQRDTSANTVAAAASVVLSNRNSTSGTFLAGGIFSNTWRDVSTSQYTAGVWFEKQNSATVGTSASQGAVVFGANDFTAGGSLPVERMRITSAGDVCIGTTGALLSAAGRGNITLNGSSNAVIAFGIAGASSAYIYSTTTNFEIDATGSKFLNFRTNSLERMRINSSGNVSVGTTTGNARFTVQGDSTIQLFNAAGSNQSDIYFADAQTLAIASYNASGSAIRFNTNPNAGGATERMRITSTGNLLINTTTAVSTLTVNGDIDANFFINSNQISANYTVPANFNAMTAGPITINTGITVTVSTGSVWTVI